MEASSSARPVLEPGTTYPEEQRTTISEARTPDVKGIQLGTGIAMVLSVNGAGGVEHGTTGMRPAVDGSCGIAGGRCANVSNTALIPCTQIEHMKTM